MGVSTRRLNGWEPAEVTTFEYDSAGRVVRQVTVRESEFDTGERARLLASRRVEAETGSHGISMFEATDPANVGTFIVNEAPKVDYARLALLKQQDKYYTAYPGAKDDRSAHLWYIKGRDE